MRKNNYVRCEKLKDYEGWEIVQILPKIDENHYDMAIITKDEKEERVKRRIEDFTTEELINEFKKRLEKR